MKGKNQDTVDRIKEALERFPKGCSLAQLRLVVDVPPRTLFRYVVGDEKTQGMSGVELTPYSPLDGGKVHVWFVKLAK